jgi:hypothetical protein
MCRFLGIRIHRPMPSRLAVNTGFGYMRNLLDNATRPQEAVGVRGRTSYGEITIHRS